MAATLCGSPMYMVIKNYQNSKYKVYYGIFNFQRRPRSSCRCSTTPRRISGRWERLSTSVWLARRHSMHKRPTNWSPTTSRMLTWHQSKIPYNYKNRRRIFNALISKNSKWRVTGSEGSAAVPAAPQLQGSHLVWELLCSPLPSGQEGGRVARWA